MYNCIYIYKYTYYSPVLIYMYSYNCLLFALINVVVRLCKSSHVWRFCTSDFSAIINPSMGGRLQYWSCVSVCLFLGNLRKYSVFHMMQYGNGKSTYMYVWGNCCKTISFQRKSSENMFSYRFWSIAILKFSQSSLVLIDVCWHCCINFKPFAGRFF